ncbi:MAG: carotenoid biosynthesis protein [Anaerolineae bacterium]
MTTLNRFTDQLISLPVKVRLQYALIVAWMLAMIAVPILKWTYGEDIIPTAITFALLVQFTAVLYAVYQAWGWRSTLITFALVAVSTWGAEYLGSTTGFPFGSYDYTDRLQPQIGHVPVLIPLAWFMMLPSAWTVAERLAGRRQILAYIAISAAAMTAWDLFLDPQMVGWGFWVWENPQGYFGIPWVNYAGWLLTSAVVTVIVRPWRYAMPVVPLLTIYGVVWFLQSVGLAVFWGQPGPALVGSVVMGALLWLAVRYEAKERTA